MSCRYLAEFTPVSGLVFRDARPFQAGENNVSFNLDFPPPPEAFWSALNRTLNRAGARGPARSLRVRGFYLVDKQGALLPAMADLVTVQDNSGRECFRILGPQKPAPDIARGPGELQLLWLSEGGVRSQPCEKTFLRPDSFLTYLQGDMGTQSRSILVGLKALFGEESRTGTQLDGRNAQQGRLYTERIVFPNRAKAARFRLLFETREELRPEVLTDHLVRLGGEGKMAQMTISKDADDQHPALPNRARDNVLRTISENRNEKNVFRVKLCLLTPAVYSARKQLLWRPGTRTPAWRPFWMDNVRGGWCRPLFDRQRYKLRLVAAAAPKAFALGAWDRAQQDPRPLHRCQPAGTVYYCELAAVDGVEPAEALNDFFNDFWLGTLLVKTKPAAPQRSRQSETVARTRDSVTSHGLRGFGWTTIGAWNYA